MKNHPIRTALASFGMSGLVFHAPLLYGNEGFHIEAILERTKNESSRKYSGIKTVRSFDDICKDGAIELIVVNTPDHTHYELAKEALQHGKHVVIEKPFTQNLGQALELIQIARDKNLILSVFQNRRWDSDFLTVKKIIGDKLLGRLVSYEAHFDRYRNLIQQGTWKEDTASGTGTLFNLGSHLIDQAVHLFGKPEGVFADVRILRDGGKIDDSFDIWMVYPDIKVKLCSSYLVREAGPRYMLHGTKGSFLKSGTDPQEEDLKKGRSPLSLHWGAEPEEDWGLLHTEISGKTIREKYRSLPGNYMQYYDNIHAAIRHNAPLLVKAEEAALVIKIIEACFESKRQKKIIPV